MKVGKGRQLDDGINFHVLAQTFFAHLLKFRQIVFFRSHQKLLGMGVDVVDIVGVKEVKQFFQSLNNWAFKRVVFINTKHKSGDLQNLLGKFVTFFVTFGLKILRLFRPKVLFEANIIKW